MHVVANAAMSVDGKLSTRRREPVAISGAEDFARVDRLRADCDAVMVGVGTVLADDPSLTVDDPALVADREDRGEPAQPTRVVADSRARTPADARLLDDAAPTVVLVAETAPGDRVGTLEAAGATVLVAGGERVDLVTGMAALGGVGIDSLLVEGGGELLFSAFAAGLVDELSVFVGSVLIGGREAPTLVDGEGFVDELPSLALESVERMDEGVLLRYRPSAR